MLEFNLVQLIRLEVKCFGNIHTDDGIILAFGLLVEVWISDVMSGRLNSSKTFWELFKC